MPNSERAIKITPEELLEMIEKVKARIKKTKLVRDLFDEYGVDIDELDYIPMAFCDLDVSARTDHGCLFFGYKLLEDGDFEKDDHYIVHELTHWLQQTTGNKPTEGSDDDEYLDDPDEKEGFLNQTEYLEDTRGPEVAEEYVDKLLDHHDINGDERKERKQELLDRKANLLTFLER